MIISVDFDGTICTGSSFDIPFKTPNLILIEKINYLKKKGHYIKIVTARGALSLSLTDREQKYKPLIEKFLEDNRVMYDEISFNKEFADMYIDDLSIRPNEAINIEDISGSFTKNLVVRANGMVIKSGPTVHDEFRWYSMMDLINKPEITNISRQSISYKYIDNNSALNIYDLFNLIESFAHKPSHNKLKFNSYIERIVGHVKGEYPAKISTKLIDCLSVIKVPPTFSHGDMSVKNILCENGTLKLIDPICTNNHFSSFMIDHAKFLFTLKFYNGNIDAFNRYKSKINIDFVDVLIASESARVSTYNRKFKFITENLINEL